MLGVMFQKNFMLLDALCGILLLGKKTQLKCRKMHKQDFPSVLGLLSLLCG